MESPSYWIEDAIDNELEEWKWIKIVVDEWTSIKDEKNKILSGLSWNLKLKDKFNTFYNKVDLKFEKDENYVHKTTINELSLLKNAIIEVDNNFRERTKEENIMNKHRKEDNRRKSGIKWWWIWENWIDIHF